MVKMQILVVKNIVKILSLIILFPSLTFASEKENICIKYRKNFGWSKGYSVQGTVISGSDLNSAVGSFTRFKSFSTYVVVFWDEDQASIFELPASSFGSVPIFPAEVEDQEGRKWTISSDNGLCF